MARPHPTPQPDPDDHWPFCDEEPPGISIRPLRHGDLQALLAHRNHDHDEGLLTGPAAGGPVVTVRVRASVGRPGASAHAEYRRRRATERANWTHGLPWRAGAVLAAALTAWVLGAQVAADLAGLLAVVATAGLSWRLRFRPSADTLAWRRGAAGERRTARLLTPLERRGWAVLHDLAIPGSPANIDHLVIGPAGVLVIDSKQYRGRLRLDRDGLLWHGRHLLVSVLRKVLWAADQADEVPGRGHRARAVVRRGADRGRGRLGRGAAVELASVAAHCVDRGSRLACREMKPCTDLAQNALLRP